MMRKAFFGLNGRFHFTALLFLVGGSFTPLCLWAEAPAWWATRGVLNLEAVADDYAAVNQGQVKHIAKQAYEEFEEKLPGGAGSALDVMWSSPAAGIDDYVAINVGQLKNVVKPFYDRLIIGGLATSYPWPAAGPAADDFTLANIGQVKNLFSFSIPIVLDPNDADADGIMDSWEIAHFGDLSAAAAGDPDADGLSNLAEFLAGSNPNGGASSVSVEVLGFSVYSP
jgi:hypothetical protein